MEKVYDFDFVFDAQKTFRKLMDSMSHPFKKYSILEESKGFEGDQSFFMAIGCTILDNETTFYVERNVSLMEEISELTLVKSEDIMKADYLFLSSELNYETIRTIFSKAKKGTFEDPHSSATIVIYTKTNEKTSKILCKGPGIKDELIFDANEYIKNVLSVRSETVAEYPLGIDLIFVQDNGEIFSVPRLVKTMEV